MLSSDWLVNQIEKTGARPYDIDRVTALHCGGCSNRNDLFLHTTVCLLEFGREFRHNKIVQSPHENYFNVCRQHKEK